MKWSKRLLPWLLGLLMVLLCVFGGNIIELFIPSYTGQIRIHEMQSGNAALQIEGSEEMRFYPWSLFREENCIRLDPSDDKDNDQYSIAQSAIAQGFSVVLDAMRPPDGETPQFPVLYDEKLDMYFVHQYPYETVTGAQRFLNAVIQNDTLIYLHCAAGSTALLEEKLIKSSMEQLTNWAMEGRPYSEGNLVWDCISDYEYLLGRDDPSDVYHSPFETSTEKLRCTMLPCGSEIFIMIDCPLSLNMMFYDPTLNQITGYGVKGS